ncbi:MAG: ComF family protein [Hyphomicrobiales bacterium]|nr:ComF family protein [Hyphomicrobiales bacterium]MCP4999363.1 ComF family protein [Hyphomicrobiales bacterium]
MPSRSVNSMVLSIGAQFRHALHQAGDIIYPPVCIGCGEVCGGHGGLCGDCWSTLRPMERPWREVLGTPFSYDMGDAVLSADAIADPPAFAKARSAVLYDEAARLLVQRLKYKDRVDLAGAMAGWMARAGGDVICAAETVVPVPLHRRRLMKRQYNQAAELARALAVRTRLPYLPAALLRTRATRLQVGLGTQARADNVKGAFAVPAGRQTQIAGKAILLVDDVYTTGATVKAATRALLKAGAGKAFVLTFARVASGEL